MKKTLITLALTMVSGGVFAQMDNSNMNHENMEHGQMVAALFFLGAGDSSLQDDAIARTMPKTQKIPFDFCTLTSQATHF